MSNPKIFITEDLYLACMSLTYTTNKIDYVAFIIGEKICDGVNNFSVGLILYLSDLPNHEMTNYTFRLMYEKASDSARLIGNLCDQPLKVVGVFHPHLHTFSTEPTSNDVKIFDRLSEKEPTLFYLIASTSTDASKQIHSSTIQAYRNKKGNVQPVNFTIVPSGRKVFFDKIFSLSQIYHMLKRRELAEYEKLKENRSQISEFFLQKLMSQKVFERYSYHVHRFVYPAFQIIIQDKKIIKTLEQFYSMVESESVKGEKKAYPVA